MQKHLKGLIYGNLILGQKRETLPKAAKILFDHANLPNTSEYSITEQLNKSYTERLY